MHIWNLNLLKIDYNRNVNVHFVFFLDFALMY